MANRPSAVAFDVVETLMSLQPLAARVVDVTTSTNRPRRSRDGPRGRCGTGWDSRRWVTTRRSERPPPRRCATITAQTGANQVYVYNANNTTTAGVPDEAAQHQ